jgi:hypothetical protein
MIVEITLPIWEFEYDLSEEELAKVQAPTSTYIFSKRLVQEWLAKATEGKERQAIAILDIAAGHGEFSDIICDHAGKCEKSAPKSKAATNAALQI